MEKFKQQKRLIMVIISAIILGIIVLVNVASETWGEKEWESVKDIFVRLVKTIAFAVGCVMVENLILFIMGAFHPKNHRAQTLMSLFGSLLKYVMAIVIICGALLFFGVNVTGVIATVGVVALVIGFSAESLIEDMITGLFMMLENQYNVGDILEVGGFRGTVTSIGIRTTCITDPGGNIKIINNSQMKNILNRSDRVSRAFCEIAIPYQTDLEKLESQIPAMCEEIYNNHTDKMKAIPVYLGVSALADSAIVLKFICDVQEADIYAVCRILNHDILLGFRKLGVECPFPQLDVHSS